MILNAHVIIKMYPFTRRLHYIAGGLYPHLTISTTTVMDNGLVITNIVNNVKSLFTFHL